MLSVDLGYNEALQPCEGVGKAARKGLWRRVLKRISQDEHLRRYTECTGDYQKIVDLANGQEWMNMVPQEWRDIYGAIYEEARNFMIDEKSRMQIEKDVHRTYGLFSKTIPQVKSTLKRRLNEFNNSLSSVLNASSHERGYCQGLNFFAAVFLLSEENERCAFTLISYILKHRHLDVLFNSKCSSLMEYMKIFEKKLRRHNKEVYMYFKDIMFAPVCYAIEWFTTCFVVTAPGDVSFCVIDLMFADCENIMIRVGLAIMDLLQPKIMQTNLEDLQVQFKRMVSRLDATDVMVAALSIDLKENKNLLQVMQENIEKLDTDKEIIDTLREAKIVDRDSIGSICRNSRIENDVGMGAYLQGDLASDDKNEIDNDDIDGLFDSNAGFSCSADDELSDLRLSSQMERCMPPGASRASEGHTQNGLMNMFTNKSNGSLQSLRKSSDAKTGSFNNKETIQKVRILRERAHARRPKDWKTQQEEMLAQIDVKKCSVLVADDSDADEATPIGKRISSSSSSSKNLLNSKFWNKMFGLSQTDSLAGTSPAKNVSDHVHPSSYVFDDNATKSYPHGVAEDADRKPQGAEVMRKVQSRDTTSQDFLASPCGGGIHGPANTGSAKPPSVKEIGKASDSKSSIAAMRAAVEALARQRSSSLTLASCSENASVDTNDRNRDDSRPANDRNVGKGAAYSTSAPVRRDGSCVSLPGVGEHSNHTIDKKFVSSTLAIPPTWQPTEDFRRKHRHTYRRKSPHRSAGGERVPRNGYSDSRNLVSMSEEGHTASESLLDFGGQRREPQNHSPISHRVHGGSVNVGESMGGMVSQFMGALGTLGMLNAELPLPPEQGDPLSLSARE